MLVLLSLGELAKINISSANTPTNRYDLTLKMRAKNRTSAGGRRDLRDFITAGVDLLVQCLYLLAGGVVGVFKQFTPCSRRPGVVSPMEYSRCVSANGLWRLLYECHAFTECDFNSDKKYCGNQ